MNAKELERVTQFFTDLWNLKLSLTKLGSLQPLRSITLDEVSYRETMHLLRMYSAEDHTGSTVKYEGAGECYVFGIKIEEWM